MSSNHIVVFQARAPRSHLVPAIAAALTLTAGILGALLRSTRDIPHVPTGAWLKVCLVLACGLLFFTVVLWVSRILRDRRQVVSVMESGLQTPQGYCAWNAITEATFLDNPDDPVIVVKGRYLAHPLSIPLRLADDGTLRRFVEQYGGEDNPLAQALANAGA